MSDLAADVTISLQNVTVRYRVPKERIGTFKEYAIRWVQGRVEHQIFDALSNVNLDIRRGEVFGLIGRNGAGKSTLLKVVSRVLVPNSGRVLVRGKVSPLLELGAGFHPELTGVENIYLNASLLGHNERDIRERIDSIISFAELGDFIEAPLRTYSSGMTARLGFAVATEWEPEVLILDEVLGVGDETFQEKCFQRMEDFRRQATTILMVTHNSATIQKLCNRAAWIEHGVIKKMGATPEVVQAYHQQ